MTRSARIVLNIFNIFLRGRNELHLGRPAIDSYGEWSCLLRHMLPMIVRVYSGRVPDTSKEQVFKTRVAF